MATSNSRDVPLTLSVTTVGKESVRELANEVQALAKEGGSAAPAFQQLATEIGKLANQSDLVQQTRDLASEIERLSVVETQASGKAQALTTELTQLTLATTRSAESEREAKTALLASQQALFEKRQALATLKNETSASDKESNQYTQTVKQLNTQIIQGKTEVRELGLAYRESKSATTEAEAAERTLARSLKDSSTEANAAKTALNARNESLREARTALAETGIVTRDVAAAEVQLAKNYIETVAAVDRARIARDKAASDALAAAAQEKAALEKKKADTTAYANLVDVLNAKIAASNRESAAAAKSAADASAKAGQQIADAFGTVGVRSIQQVQAEILRVRSAFDTLKNSGTLTGAELANAFNKSEAQVKTLERDVRELNGTLTLSDKAAKLFSGSMGAITAGNVIANGISMIGQKVADMGREFISAIVQGDQLRRGLTAIYKDSELAGKQLDFLRSATREAGVSIGGLSKEFVKFSASMTSANIPIDQSNDLFKSLITTSASLGLSADDTAGSLNALGQIASKGTVSLEELRAQLGDRLPGALGLTAKGMGITEQQLIKLVESGNLAARDFIVPFTKGLKTLQGETDGLVPTYERFKNLLTESAQGAGDAGGLLILTGALKVLGGFVGSVVLGLSAFVESLLLVGSGVTALAARLTGDSNAWAFFSDQVEKSRLRLTGQAESLNNFLDPAQRAAGAMTTLGVATAATAVEQASAAAAAERMSTANGLSSAAATLASDATLNLASNIIKYQIAAGAALVEQERTTEGLQKAAAAAKQQGEEMVTIAKLSGDAAQLRKAEADAANLLAKALDAVAVSQKGEVDLLLTQRSHIIDVATARNDNKASIDSQTAAVDKKLAKAAPELEQMLKTADAARAEAIARNLVSEALKDNSLNLEKFGVAVAAAKVKVAELRDEESKGKDVKVALKAAQEVLAKATYLYNDALKDSIDKVQLETRAKSANLQIAQATASASQSHYEVLAKEARARGDVTTAVLYEVQAKDQAIKQLKLKLELDRLQNAAAVLEIEFRRKEIDATTDVGKAKLKALDIELQLLKVRSLSTEGIKDQIKALELERNAIRDGTNERNSGGGGISKDTALRTQNAGAINLQVSALAALSAAQGKYSRPTSSYDRKDSENPYGLTSDGLKANADGSASGTFGSSTANQGLYDLAAKQRQGTLGAGDLEKAKAALEQANFGLEWLRAMSNASVGSVSTIAQTSAEAAVNQAKAILETVQGGIRTNGTGAQTSTANTKVVEPPKSTTQQQNATQQQSATQQQNTIQQADTVLSKFNDQLSKLDISMFGGMSNASDIAKFLARSDPGEQARLEELAKLAGQSNISEQAARAEAARIEAIKRVFAEKNTQSATTYTVNVNVGGNSQAVRVASQQDAEALTRTIQAIGQAATRSL